jgi:DNA recombination protein RmuC
VDIPSFTLFIAGLATGLLLTIWVWGFARSTIHRRDLDLASRDAALTRAQQELSLAQQDRARLGAELEAERKAAAGKETVLRDSFATLSQDALERNNRAFLALAQTKLGEFQQSARVELDGRHQAISDLVQPLKDSLARVDGKLQEVEKDRAGSNAKLDEQLRALAHTHQSLQVETNKLVRALRSPNQRGRWGEVQLRSVVERSGMVSYCDYVEKESVSSDGRRLTPDMIVRLPNGACIVIDSKVPIDAYLNAADSPDETARESLLKEHARQVRDHIRTLGAKSYWSRFSPTPELVVMFLPGDPLLGTALQNDPTLFEFAVDQRVIPASPLTLVALLRTVATAWQQQRLAENAEEIQAMGRELYERLTTMAEHVSQVGTALKRAGAAYDDFVGSLDARVMVSARRFRELGVSAPRELPEALPSIHMEIREPRATELRVPTQESLIDPPSRAIEPNARYGEASPPSRAESDSRYGETGTGWEEAAEPISGSTSS